MKRLLWLGLIFLTFQVRAQDIFPYTPTGWDGNIIVSSVVGTSTIDTDLQEGYQLYLDYALRHNFPSELEGLDIDIQIDGVTYTRRVFSSLSPDPTFGQGLDLILVLEEGTHTITIILDPEDEFLETDETNNSYELTVTVTKVNSFNPDTPDAPQALEYFIDNDPGTGNGTPVALNASGLEATENLVVDLSSASTGFHQLYLRAKNGSDWGPTERVSFINLQAPDSSVAGIEYFVDTDPGVGLGTFVAADDPAREDTLSFTVPLTDFSIGFHQLYSRARSSNGTWGTTEAVSFFNLKAASNALERIEYFVDDDPGRGNGVSVPFASTDEDISFTVDLSNENTGFHQLFVRAKNANGTWGILQHSAFLVEKGFGRRADVVSLEYFYIGPTEVSEVFTYTFPASGTNIDEVVPMDISFLNEGSNYTLVVRAIDESGERSQRVSTSFTFGVNSAPTIEDQTFSISEIVENGTLVGELVAVDADNDQLTYTIESGNEEGAFELSNSGDLMVLDSTVLNFEGTATYFLQVVVNDGRESDEATITVNLEDANDAPVIDDQSFSLTENSASDTEVGQLVATDEDEDNLSYAIVSGNESGAFALSNAGLLTIAEATEINFEVNPTFELVVTASDGATATEATITVSLEDVNEAPEISAQSFTIEENTVADTEIGQIIASDEDEDNLSYSIKSGNEAGAFALSASGLLTVADATVINFEVSPTFELVVTVSDDMAIAEAAVTVDLENVNEAPEISAQSFTIEENTVADTEIGQITASDEDEDNLSYSIESGNEAGAFELSASGLLTVADAAVINFEVSPSFELVVTVSDASTATDATITVSLENVNDAPEITTQSFIIDENSVAGTEVGQIQASDEDKDDITFSLQSGNTNGAFALSSTGLLTVLTTDALDFETQSQWSLVVEVMDETGLTDEATIQVSLTDVSENENISPVLLDVTFNLDENSAEGTVVAQLEASDENGDELSFSILSGNTDDAFLLSDDGILTVQTTSAIDFETNPDFVLQVRVTDGNGGSDEAQVSINLNDLIENTAPVITEQTFTLQENSANGTIVGVVVASDPESDVLNFTIVSGNDQDAFTLNETTGELSVDNESALDFETTPVFNLMVTVTDSELSAEATITITLTDVDESVLSSDMVSKNVQVYPNPTSDMLIIDWTPFFEAWVFDVSGQELIRSQSNKLDLGHLKSGLYVLLLISKDGHTVTQKISKH